MRYLVLLFALYLHATSLYAAEPVFRSYRHPVLIWVPPYAVAKSASQLQQSTFTPAPAEVLTHVALQWWRPTTSGGLAYASDMGPVDDAAVATWRTWAQARGIRLLLCVYNAVERKWDWPLARAAFAEHPEEFANALVETATRLGLDGVDIDLEGNREFNGDKAPYLHFLQLLASKLHSHGKQLFADSFCDRWNTPNQTWWAEMLPLVDGLTTMGYADTGAHSAGWRGYPAQVAAAGPYAAKLLLGLPTHKDAWQDAPAAEHLAWLAQHPVGVGLWDAQLAAPGWRTSAPWQTLQRISAPPAHP